MSATANPAHGKWLMAAVSMSLFCVQIDYFAMNLALPRIATDFSSTATDLQWIVSIYMVTLGALMVPAGRLAAIFGRKRALLTGIAVFGLASLLCAIASSVATLVAFRTLQGAGAALIFPASVSVITNAFPAAQAGRMIGLAYGIAGLGNAAGPLIGGLLTQTVGWRWIFALNIPLTAACAIIGVIAISESRDPDAPRRIDLAGLALLTSGIGAFTLTFDRAPVWGWWSPATIGAFTGAIALLALFVVVERRVRWPLVDLSLVRNLRFTVLVAGEPAGCPWTRPVGGRNGFSRPLRRCRGRRRLVRTAGGRTPGAGDGCHDSAGGRQPRAARVHPRLGPVRARTDGMRIHPGLGLCLHDGGYTSRGESAAGRGGGGNRADRDDCDGRCRGGGGRHDAGTIAQQRNVDRRRDRRHPRRPCRCIAACGSARPRGGLAYHRTGAALRMSSQRAGDPQMARAAVLKVTPWLSDDTAPEPDRNEIATAVRLTARALAVLAPGASVEVRIPPFVAVQCISGPEHTRGTPPNVAESDPRTWLLLVTGLKGVDEAVAEGLLRLSGSRAQEISTWFPLVRLEESGGI